MLKYALAVMTVLTFTAFWQEVLGEEVFRPQVFCKEIVRQKDQREEILWAQVFRKEEVLELARGLRIGRRRGRTTTGA